MPIRDASRVSGSLMDFTRLSALPADDCEVLLVSSRTLYILANYAVNEVNYLARYFLEEYDGDLVRVAEESDPEVPLIREIAQGFRLEVIPVTCDLVSELRAIASAINSLQLAGCCPPTGTYPPQPPTSEQQPPPEGFREYDSLIDDRKCKLANMAIDDLIAVINLLIVNDVDDIASLGVGAMSALWALVVAAIPAGPVALALGALGAVISLVGFFIVNTLDLAGLITIIEDNREDLVCAIYTSPDNTSAYNAIYSILDDAGFNSVDLLFLDTLHLLDGLTAVFYAPDDETGDAIEARLDGYTATIDCSVCPAVPDYWTLVPGGGELPTMEGGSTCGTGVINNFGAPFTITASKQTGIERYHVAMVVGAYLPQVNACGWNIPCWNTVAYGGTVTWVSGSDGGPFNEIRGVRAELANCGGGVAGGTPFGATVSTQNNAQYVHWVRSVPFSMTFTIDSLPILCP